MARGRPSTAACGPSCRPPARRSPTPPRLGPHAAPAAAPTDAGLYDTVSTATLSQGTLFRAQAAVAAVVAIALLIRPHPAVWAIAALVAASAATAVLLYTYVDAGALGPLPDMYEPTWALPGKRASAVAEIAAALLAGTGLVLSLRTGRGPSAGQIAVSPEPCSRCDPDRDGEPPEPASRGFRRCQPRLGYPWR
jgi:hypothetical protein